MKKDIERLTEETLNSLDGIQPAEANPFLFAKIQNRLDKRRAEQAGGSVRIMYRLASLLLLFICINLASYFLMKDKSTKVASNASAIKAFANDYDLEQSSYNY